MEVLVLGGGASGMMSAISAKIHNNCKVTIIEKQSRVGKKLAVTGNGRCNISNRNMSIGNYHGEDNRFIEYALKEFNVDDMIKFFKSIGLLLKDTDNGRIYPFNEQSSSVVDVLRFELERRNIDVVLNTEVNKIEKNNNKFVVTTENGCFIADKVIVASGGAASRNISGSMSGYNILKEIGHTSTKIYPSLVQIKTDSRLTKSLKGVRADVKIRICLDKKELISNYGEIQFTDYGISGPVVFEVSRIINNKNKLTAHIDFLSKYRHEELYDIIYTKTRNYSNQVIENLLVGTIHNKIGRVILKSLGYNFVDKISSLKETDIKRICDSIKDLKINIEGNMGLEYAQVTMGGIKTKEIDNKTMQSLICKGLYLCGEVIDIDGDCGGYNLQWAWSSGFLAGKLL